MWKNLLLEGLESYQVNDETGQIRNTIGRFAYQILDGRLTEKGYIRVCLTYTDRHEKEFFLHDLIYWTFVEFFDTKKFTVNHINEIKTDNRLVNLKKMTHAANNNFGTRNQRISESMKNNPLICEPVECIETGEIFSSMKEAQQIKGIENISRAIRRDIRAGGYHWKKVKKED